ncbi:hypothetical protein RB248 [Rhodopirellula baltica SH 1]|uniref:Uncharacterized protein n=1 Tax=Rhodopirellula baltica (strain DSM 10527 / NCIMB 13988 / SH1) TaxID=243090 RepID=Q7UZ23_RHOBA|nr:hypothetical protein RB248 [Rhodopirellula baltica SH 1]
MGQNSRSSKQGRSQGLAAQDNAESFQPTKNGGSHWEAPVVVGKHILAICSIVQDSSGLGSPSYN